jgi:Outer membrane protein beta-barrel domain
MPSLAALPAAPGSNGAGGGQYDNNSRGGGGGGIVSHLTYEVGGGFNAPTSDSAPYITWGYNFTVGAGYRFDKHFALNLEYQFIHSKLPGAIIDQAGATGGYAHIWSFTLDPYYDLNPKSAVEFYATGGYGFYRKVTSFTDPQLQIYCTYFYCGTITQDVVVGHFSSNQGGWNAGGGIQHRFAGWQGDGRMRIFAEARYLDVMSPAVTTEPNGLGTTTVGEGTKIIPVTVGLRF